MKDGQKQGLDRLLSQHFEALTVNGVSSMMLRSQHGLVEVSIVAPHVLLKGLQPYRTQPLRCDHENEITQQ